MTLTIIAPKYFTQNKLCIPFAFVNDLWYNDM